MAKEATKVKKEIPGKPVNRAELVAVLGMVAPAVAANGEQVTQGDCFIFSDGKVVAFNDDMSVSHPCACHLVGAVKAQEFMTLLSRYKAEVVNIDQKEGEVVIHTKDGTSGVVFSPTNSDITDAITQPTKWYKLPSGFCAALLVSSKVCDLNSNVPIQSNVYVSGETCWATDNYQILVAKMGGEVKKPMFIGAGFAKHIVKYEPIEYGLSDGWAHFRNDAGVIISVRTVEVASGEDLNVDFAIKKGAKLAVTGDYGESIQRLRAVAGDETEVDIKIRNGILHLKVKGQFGWVHEKLKATCPVEAAFRLHVFVLEQALAKSSTMMFDDKSIYIDGENFQYGALCLEEEATPDKGE